MSRVPTCPRLAVSGAALKDASRGRGGGLTAVLARGPTHGHRVSGRDEETAPSSRTNKHHWLSCHDFCTTCRAVSCPLRPGIRLAGGPAPRQLRRAGVRRCRVGDAVQPIGRLLWLLATDSARLDQPPTDDASGFHPRDRLLRPVQQAENRFLGQLAAVIIGRRYRLGAHDPLGEFVRRNGAQLERINWLANTSTRGMRESYGLMVNYLYVSEAIAANHEAFIRTGVVAHASSIDSYR
jgi:hypothetical protein